MKKLLYILSFLFVSNAFSFNWFDLWSLRIQIGLGRQVDARGYDLSGIDFTPWIFYGYGYVFQGADFRYSNLNNTNFSGFNLYNANFYSAVINDSDFSYSNLRFASFNNATINNSNFSEATDFNPIGSTIDDYYIS